MQKPNEDCFYFLTSSCAKGSSCPYRHSPLALTSNVICPAWIRSNCLDSACPLRHSHTIQCSMVNNGILCFYENTRKGCLKLDCTFIHSRPRLQPKTSSLVRSASMNLVNKDNIKPMVASVPSPLSSPLLGIPPKDNVSQSTINTCPAAMDETQLIASSNQVAVSSNPDESLPKVKKETVSRRVAVLSENEQSMDTMTSSDTSSSNLTKITTRSVITNCPERKADDVTAAQSRLVVNRNVVLAESVSSSSRTIVQATSSSRVVVSSTIVQPCSSKLKRNVINFDNLAEQENDSKKFKSESRSTTDISFPTSTPYTTTARILLVPTKTVIPPDGAKTIQSNRDRLPKSKPLNVKLSKSVSTSSTETKKSTPGTGLSQEVARRTSRIERFKPKPISPPRSIVSAASPTIKCITTNSLSTRDVIASSPNERKRTAPTTIMKNSPPSKRISTPSVPPPKRPPGQSPSSSSSINEKRRGHGSAAKTIQTENSGLVSTTTTIIPSKSMVHVPVRPRFTPEPIRPPSPLSSLSTKTQRCRQPPSVVIKRPLVPITAPFQTTTQSVGYHQSNTTENHVSPPKSTIPSDISNNSSEEDEYELLKLNESSDVVDTFALIDEALLEADHLLELI